MKKKSLTIIIVTILALMSHSITAQAATIPTISIVGVTKDEKVTVQTHDFPAGKDFEVRMGLLGTKAIGGILVGTVDSRDGGSLKFTFDIPAALCSKSAIAIRFDSTTGGYYSYNWFTNTTFGTHEGGLPADELTGMPSVIVVSVKKDTVVTVKGTSFPSDEDFDVLMGEYDADLEDLVMVDTITADENNRFLQTFDIPASLHSSDKLTIHFESKDSDKFASADFANVTGACGGTGITDGTDSYTGIPTISITSVEEDETVTLQTHNFPMDKEFVVLMGKIGTKGVGGIEVAKFNSGDGGSFSKTFDIPDSLKGLYQIAIRLQTSDNHYYAYNWFFNNTTDGTTPDGYAGIPTFTIIGVKKGETLTIKTNNFPADIDFKVLMGKMGTQGVDGILVETIDSGTGGAFTDTFDIPDTLARDARIAIRLQATTGGFYAYNWFYNATYP